ncbi:MAG: 50S ribosomal protein L5 [bacterium]|jgi:large subunit ribosomal protein L5|tara:strand:+ start:1400 stop:1945 length:546 start_codon:yes stop_codon:yes gene_type:complete
MMQSHLYETYQTKTIGLLKEKYGYKNVHQIPKIQKVNLNMGLGEALQNPKVIEEASKQMAMIAGQKPVVTRAKKSIAAFKLREKVAIGCMVTLRRQNMWNFLDKLIHVAIPRVRDFRGISPRSFDGSGNYTMGIREQLIFPEIDFDQIDQIRGMNITIVTSTDSDQESRDLLEGMGFPFRN